MHHGASLEVRHDLDLQIHEYLDSSESETVWLKRAKWALAYPLSKYLRNELPPPPDQVFRPVGVLRSWMKMRLTAFCRRNTHLWYSWLQAKRSALPASESIVEKTYDDHFTSLTRDDPGVDPVIDRIFENDTFRRLLDTLRATITEDLPKDRPFDDYSASSSACFEQTRGSGGQHQEIRRLVGMDEFCSSELSRMDWKPVTFGASRRTNVTWEYRRLEGSLTWLGVRSLASQYDASKPISCTIQAVLEPMKVRVISKGEALPYYTMKPLQKVLHSAMRKMDCFRLIGRPLSPCDFFDLVEKAATPWKWFSIDYSAATDGLSWKYSGRILKYLIADLPESQQRLALSVLGPHSLHYPNGSSKVFRGVQRNGQLMGSILSFPILCLANVGVYLDVMRDVQFDWTDREKLRHVLVNGDDMVYAGPELKWKVHATVSEQVGLKMSVGKAYIHNEYLNVNSTSVSMRIDKPSTPWVIPYLNSGLFYGQHKVQGRKDDEAASHHEYSGGLVDNLNVVLSGSLPGRQADLLKYFLFSHREEVAEECKILVKKGRSQFFMTRNLFIPKCHGGMGVECPTGFDFRITQNDRALARALLDRCTAKRSYCSPLPGHEVSWLERMDHVAWAKFATDDSDVFSAKGFIAKAIRISEKKISADKVLRPTKWWWDCPAYAA
jgi:hypothetical protein